MGELDSLGPRAGRNPALRAGAPGRDADHGVGRIADRQLDVDQRHVASTDVADPGFGSVRSDGHHVRSYSDPGHGRDHFECRQVDHLPAGLARPWPKRLLS